MIYKKDATYIPEAFTTFTNNEKKLDLLQFLP